MEVTVTSNKKKVLDELERKTLLALKSIGEKAEEYAKKDCPVDTGRLRNSITHATQKYSGQQSYSDKKGNHYHDGGAKGIPDEDCVCIGTNVVYARQIEFNDRISHTVGKAHFLKDAISNHGDEYKKIAQAALEE